MQARFIRFDHKILILTCQKIKNYINQNISYLESKFLMSTFDIHQAPLPQYCDDCTFLFDEMGACPHPDASIIHSYISLIPYLIILFLPIIIMGTRRVMHIYLLLMLGSAYVFGDKILKNIIKSPRPIGACKRSYGLPSSHMTVMVSYGYYAFCYYTDWKLKTIILIMCILQGMARYQLHYHTLSQVLLGTVFGLLYSIIFTRIFTFVYKTWIKQTIIKTPFIKEDFIENIKID